MLIVKPNCGHQAFNLRKVVAASMAPPLINSFSCCVGLLLIRLAAKVGALDDPLNIETREKSKTLVRGNSEH